MTKRRWVGAVLLFFTWGFVMHGAGLLLHEIGGHDVAASALGCGSDWINFTYFGHGVVHFRSPCGRWTWTRFAIVDWSGLAVTITAGAVVLAFVIARRSRLAPLPRLLLALLATGFLLRQLGYATSGGFHDLYDPARTAIALGARGLHVVAWLVPLAIFTVAALLGAGAIVEAFREQFAPRSRLHGLGQIAAMLGAAGLLYLIAYHIEWMILSDVWTPGVATVAEVRARAQGDPPPFPIDQVQAAIGVVAFAVALARPVRVVDSASPRPIDRRLAAIVAAAAVVLFVAISALNRL